MKPKEYTKQENSFSEVLDDLGFRYERQVQFGKYTVDFYIPEIFTVVETDGIYGHFKKADRERDEELLCYHGIDSVIHIKETKEEKMRKEFMEKMCLDAGN